MEQQTQIAAEIELHMARAFFASAWADACDESGPGVGSGVEIMDAMPEELDPAATHAARTLRMDMERANGVLIETLFNACLPIWKGDRDATPEMFGHYCAMQAMGHGVGLHDAAGSDVYEFVKVPYCEFGSHSLQRDYFPETLYVHLHSTRADGTRDSFQTLKVPAKRAPLWWQERGLSFTASGYGARIPTERMILLNGRWRRVYCRIYSNAGTCYIGRSLADGFKVSGG